jgi:hypothetical protein
MNNLKLGLLTLSLLSFSSNAFETVFPPNKFILAIRQSHSGSFYGDPFVRTLVRHTDTRGVHTIYLRPLASKTVSPTNYQIVVLAQQISQTQPKFVLSDNSIVDRLRKELPKSWAAKLKSIDISDLDKANIESGASKLMKFLNLSNFIYDKIFIYHDDTPLSIKRTMLIKSGLEDSSFSPGKIVLVSIKDHHSIRKELRRIDNAPTSIIINSMDVLVDTELGVTKYSDDIKKTLTESNNMHLDIGFWISPFNEAIILIPNSTDIYKYFITKETGFIHTNLFVNKTRFNKLKLKYLYINGIGAIDGILK